MNKEPALIVMLVAWLIGLVAERVAPGQFDSGAIESVAELVLALAAAILIRAKVFSRETIRKAGLSPKTVEARAEDPLIPKYQGA